MLVELAKGGVSVRGNKGQTYHGHAFNVQIKDEDLAQAIAVQAFEAFNALNGPNRAA